MKLLEGIEKREWWIYQLAQDHITEHKPDVEKWKQSFVDEELLHHPEINHVIDSAYVERLEKMLAKAVEEKDGWESGVMNAICYGVSKDSEVHRILEFWKKKAEASNAELRQIAEGK